MLKTLYFGVLVSSRGHPKAFCCLFQINMSCTLNSLFYRNGTNFVLICWYIFLRVCTSWRIWLESWMCSWESTWEARVRQAVSGSHMFVYRRLGKLLPGGQIWLNIYFCKVLLEHSHAVHSPVPYDCCCTTKAETVWPAKPEMILWSSLCNCWPLNCRNSSYPMNLQPPHIRPYPKSSRVTVNVLEKF